MSSTTPPLTTSCTVWMYLMESPGSVHLLFLLKSHTVLYTLSALPLVIDACFSAECERRKEQRRAEQAFGIERVKEN